MSVYRFADCDLDTRTQQLFRDGEVVELQHQSYLLLLYLVRNCGRLIDKDELLREVWGNSFLTDSAIARVVMKVRTAIGDDAKQQTLLKTIRGRGVEFLAEVTVQQADAQSQRRPILLWSSLAIILLGVTVGLYSLSVSRSVPSEQAEDLSQATAQLQLPTMAIAQVSNLTADESLDWIGTGVPQTLLEHLRGEFDGYMMPEDLNAESANPEELKKFLGVDFLLLTSIRKQDDQYLADFRMQGDDLVSSTIQHPEIAMLISELARHAIAARQGVLASSIHLDSSFANPLVMELYSRAMHSLYLGEEDNAQQLLEAALTVNPDSAILNFYLLHARRNSISLADLLAEYQSLMDRYSGTVAPAMMAIVLERIGIETWYAGEVEKSREILRRAVGMLEKQGDRLAYARALNSFSIAEASSGESQNAWKLATLALSKFEQTGDDYHQSLSLTNLGYLAEDAGKLMEALDFHTRAMQIRSQYQFRSLYHASVYGVGRLQRRLGRFDEAAKLINQSLAYSRDNDHSTYYFDNLEELAEIRMHQGRYSEAEKLLAQALEVARENDDKLGIAWSEDVSCKLAIRQGNATAAIEHARRAIDIQNELGEYKEASFARLNLLHALVKADRLGDAQTQLDSLADAADTFPTDAMAILDLRRAQLAQAQANMDQARQWYEKALASANTIGSTDNEADIAQSYGHFAIAQGDFITAEVMLSIMQKWNPDYYGTLRLQSTLASATGDAALSKRLKNRLNEVFPEVLDSGVDIQKTVSIE